MKKFILGLVTVCLSICTLAFVGCNRSNSKTEEEQFNEAKQQFDNYTVQVVIQYADGDRYDNTLMVDGTKGKMVVNEDNGDYKFVSYYSEQYGKIFCYDESDDSSAGEWYEDRYSKTIEEATSAYNGYVYVLSLFFFDDLTKEGDYLVAKNDALEDYSEEYGMEIKSVKIKIEDSKFVSATAIVNYYDSRLEVQYSFKDYGSTKVDLPA